MATATEPKQGQLVIRNSNELRTTLEANASKVFAAMPRHITPERLIAICIRCFRKTPKLFECNPVSILDAIGQAAALGLEPDGVLGHAYLVPYGDECVLIPGYKGLIDLCRRSGNVSEVHLECVYEGDEFSYSKGLKPTLHHVPNDASSQDDDEKITHVYVVVRLRDGGVQFDVWPRAKVEGHKKKYSQGWRRAASKKKDSPWHTNWKEMAMKTVLRNMVARGKVPVSAEIQRMAMHDELTERDFEPPPAHQSRVAVSSLNSLLDGPSEAPALDGPHAEDASQVEPDEPQYANKAHVSPKGRKKAEPEQEYAPDGSPIPVNQLFDTPAADAVEQGQ